MRRNENITSEGKCGNLRYEPMPEWVWEQHELYTPDSLTPSVLVQLQHPDCGDLPDAACTSYDYNDTQSSTPGISLISARSRKPPVGGSPCFCLDPQTIDDRHTSYDRTSVGTTRSAAPRSGG